MMVAGGYKQDAEVEAVIESPSQQIRILWLRKFGLSSAKISEVMDNVALRGACIVSLADQEYFTADAVGRERRMKRHRALIWIARILNIGFFILLGIGLTVFFRLNPITLPIDADGNAAYAILGIAGLVLTLVLRFLLFALEQVTLAILIGILEASHTLGENLRRSLIKLGLRPVSLEPFKQNFDKSIASGKSKVFRVDDDHWQQAVTHSMENVNVVVIDISDLSENIMWEVETVFKSKPLNDIRLICNQKTLKNKRKVATINELMQPYYSNYSNSNIPVFIYDLSGMHNSDNLDRVYPVHRFVLSRHPFHTGCVLPLTLLPTPPTPQRTAESLQRGRRRRKTR